MKQRVSDTLMSRWQLAIFFLTCAVAYGCAVPVAPTGGPADSDPPGIEQISPEEGAVNVSATEIIIQFDEYVDQASFQRAFEITPEPATPPSFQWKKKRVTITFREPLRPNTTYIVTLDTNLRDRNSVPIARPEVVAFSTGPTINRGTLTGTVIQGQTGDPASGFEVHAYLLEDTTSFPAEQSKPDYRTQSDADGNFGFSYLAERAYHVLAFNDLNSNKTLDEGEASGSSLHGWWRASEDSTTTSPTIVTAVTDTTGPTVRRVASASTIRSILTYSEAVATNPAPGISFQDSSGTITQAVWWYRVGDDGTRFGAVSLPLEGAVDAVTVAADSVGNTDSSRVTFNVADRPDTVSLAVQEFFSLLPADTTSGTIPFLTDDSFGLTTNGVYPPDSLQDFLTVESGGTEIPVSLRSLDGKRIVLEGLDNARLPDSLEISVDASIVRTPDSVSSAIFVRLPTTSRGELAGVFRNPDSSAVVFQLQSDEIALPDALAVTSVSPGAGDSFVFSNLPEGRYRIRAFADQNGNGKWDHGTLFPFEPFEPVVWTSDTLRVRPRWESVLADTIDLNVYDYRPE